MKSIYENLNRIRRKDVCYSTYEILTESEVDYDKISRKQMIDDCIKLYIENPNIINYIYNEEELDDLYTLKDIVTNKDNNVSKYYEFFLYTIDDRTYTITEELYDVLKQAKELYYNHKKEIEKEKEIQYIIVGLIRSYGALTLKELSTLVSKLSDKEFDITLREYYYFKRFATFDDYPFTPVITLYDLEGYCLDFIDSHPKDMRLLKTKIQYINIGCNYFDTDSIHYKNAIRHKKINEFLETEFDKQRFILLAGANLGMKYYIEFYEEFLDSLNYDERNDMENFFNSIPRYMMHKNQDNILSSQDGELFYKIMMPMIKFMGQKYNKNFQYSGNTFDGKQAYDILNKCLENDFKYLDEYIKKSNLNNEERDILNNLYNHIKGPFVILKHQKKGSVFMDKDENLYLVKGIKTQIQDMAYLNETPAICDTFIFQFKDSIIYSCIIAPYKIQMVGNMKKYHMDIYKKKKNSIITKL